MTCGVTSLKTPRVNPDWPNLPLFDRTGWTRLPFGQFAENVNVRVEPADAADEIYVGLEHLDSGSLHVRRWGKGSDVIGTKLRFRKGDIIFGRRRAYQRKLAVAETDGICSAHAMVVRAKRDLVLPEFLPFLMTSDKFMNRAVEISVGSLSPTINWTTLRLQEFDLPPLEQQRRIADSFLVINEVLQSHLAVRDTLGGLLESSALRHFRELTPRNTPLGALIKDGDVELQTGPFGTVLAASSYTNTGIPVVNPVNMNGDSFDTSRGPFISPEDADRLGRYQMHPGDIVMCRKRHVGRMVEVRDEHDGHIVGSDCIRIRANPSRLLSRFLLLYLRSGTIQRWLVRATIGSVMPGMNEAILGKLEIPVPEREIQEHVVASLGRILDAIVAVKSDVDEIGQLTQALQNQVFADKSLQPTAAQP